MEVLIYWWLFFSRKEHLKSYPIETFVVGRLIGVPVNRTPPAYCESTCSQYTLREPGCNCIFLEAADIVYPETEESAIYVTTHIRYLINQTRSILSSRQAPRVRATECTKLLCLGRLEQDRRVGIPGLAPERLCGTVLSQCR